MIFDNNKIFILKISFEAATGCFLSEYSLQRKISISRKKVKEKIKNSGFSDFGFTAQATLF